MKKTLFLSFLFLYATSFAQIKISGRVINENNNSVEAASVYLNNTTIGVSTKADGSFELNTTPGAYVLIVSYIGYKTIQHQLNTANYTKPLTFKLAIQENILNEVVLKKTIYNAEWKFNLEQFKNNFLGRTNLAKRCEILNPKTLHFEFDKKTGILTAEVKEPLLLKHKDLGYLITFDLVHFSLSSNKVNYYGYTKFENLKGGKRKEKRWKKNRLKAFYGSKMHFVRSLINGTTKEEGYNINRIRRERNPDRPTEKQIEYARQIVKLSGIKSMSLQKSTQPYSAADSAVVILRKATLPKYKNYLYKQGIAGSELVVKKAGKNILYFQNYISVIYTKEAEEKNYVMGIFGQKREPLSVQTSAATMLTKTAILDKTGEIINPLDVFFEGYWAYEQFADALPLNYQPSKD
jgi:hypothetical protein